MATNVWTALAARLITALTLETPPIGISFSAEAPAGVGPCAEPMSDPASDGRRGRVPASCVFWMKAASSTFTTVAADHGNCSVGKVVHGFATLADVGGNSDVAALLGSGWVDEAAVGGIPTVGERPGFITYGPLAEAPADPDVVLVRLDGRQLMVLTDALPGLGVAGKPQCQIVAIARERGEVAVSVGCALSRERTGMSPAEMTCAIPGARLETLVAQLEGALAIDQRVAAYASEDARRFPGGRGQ